MGRSLNFVLAVTLVVAFAQTGFSKRDVSEIQPAELVNIGGINYYIEYSPRKWLDAANFCSALSPSMKLISLENQSKDLQIREYLLGRGLGETMFWTSGHKSLGTWKWMNTNATITYFRWYPGEPNDVSLDICVQFKAQHGWYDYSCDYDYGFMCQ